MRKRKKDGRNIKNKIGIGGEKLDRRNRREKTNIILLVQWSFVF